MSIINLTPKVAIIGIGIIASLAILLCIYLIIKVYLLSDRIRNIEWHRSNSNTKHVQLNRSEVINIVIGNDSRFIDFLNKKFDEHLRKPSTLSFIAENISSRVRLQSKDVPKVPIDKKPINQVPTVQAPVQEEKPVSQPEFLKTPMPNKQEIANRVFYVSGLDEKDDKTFCDVSEQPTDETIFKFSHISNSKSSYTIYEGAFAKVLKDDSFLTGACQIARMGNNKVVVTEKGVAELTSDNKWVVITPAKVRFE